MKRFLTILLCFVVVKKTSAQETSDTKNFLQIDTVKIELGNIPWEKQSGYEYEFRIRNYWTDTILYPKEIKIYHDSWINPEWARPNTPLARKKSSYISVIIYPHRSEDGGSLQKSGSFYVYGKDKSGKWIRELYPVLFHCTVAAKLPDTTVGTKRSMIRTDEK